MVKMCAGTQKFLDTPSYSSDQSNIFEIHEKRLFFFLLSLRTLKTYLSNKIRDIDQHS